MLSLKQFPSSHYGLGRHANLRNETTLFPKWDERYQSIETAGEARHSGNIQRKAIR
jgi:hypothetical protein